MHLYPITQSEKSVAENVKSKTITRLYTGADNQSHFEELEIEMMDKGPIGFLSKNYPTKSVIFRETDGKYDYSWHNAPQKQYIIILEGMVEITVGNGEKRLFETGDILLAEDLTGQGHKSRCPNNRKRYSLFITID